MARKRVMKGGFFSGLYKKFNKERIADCKDWLKRQQKKRKMKGGSKTQKGARKGTRKGAQKGARKGARKGTRKGTRKQTGGSKSWKDSRLRRDLKATLSFI